MSVRAVLGVGIGASLLCLSAVPVPAAGAAVHDGTRADVQAAMKGEAFAYAKYHAFAAQAKRDGNAAAATAFREAGRTELGDHFRQEAALIGFVGSDATNLREAIAGESYETRVMYPAFAHRAAKDGDSSAAELFAEIGQDEAVHLKAFRDALAAVEGTGSQAVPAGPTVVPEAIPAGPATSSGRTLTNMRAAMHGEAFAHAKYEAYGKAAARNGNRALADLFARIAQVELREHFAAEAVHAGLVSTTYRNLRAAAAGERREGRGMYPRFARRADRAGDHAAAALFREIAGDELMHHQMFMKLIRGQHRGMGPETTAERAATPRAVARRLILL